MIVTCASCLTKYNLDDSRISLKGVKVRCSRCKHVFYVVPPPERREEIIEDFESFAKYHEELMGRTTEPQEAAKKEEIHEEEEKILFGEKPLVERVEPIPSVFPSEEEKPEAKSTFPRKRVRKVGWVPSRFFILVIILIILVLGLFYAWTEMGTGGRLFPLIETPFKKLSAIWDQIWGLEKEGLFVGDLNRYDERIGDTFLSVIEGKVKNQSKYTKKHIKVKVLIFDQSRNMVASQEVVCGRSIGREALRNLLPSLSKEEIAIHPQTVKEKEVPPGKAVPFMVVFKNIPEEAKEFKVEIVEAPSL
ncbi:MAG: DUF3426 domain-containing protein [Thermodesulfobacteriota bacterium]